MGHVGSDGAAEWWRGAVLYQVYPRSFQDSDGDGIGDLPGLIDRLDHIAALGVDAIWVCPFYPSPQRDFGYDVADHCAVDPAFGRLEDVDRLIAAAHARGLRVLFDLVGGHTSDRHPWFQASRRNREAPTGDWYVWADPRPDGTPPEQLAQRLRRPRLDLGAAAPAVLPAPFPEQPAGAEPEQPGRAGRAARHRRVLAGPRRGRLPARRARLPHPRPGAPRQPGEPAVERHGARQAVRHAAPPPRHDPARHQAGAAAAARADGPLPRPRTLGEVSSQDGAYERIAGYTEGRDLLHMAYTLRPLRHGFDHPTVTALLADAIAPARAAGPASPSPTTTWSAPPAAGRRAASPMRA